MFYLRQLGFAQRSPGVFTCMLSVGRFDASWIHTVFVFFAVFIHLFASCTVIHGQGKPTALLTWQKKGVPAHGVDHLTCENVPQLPLPFYTLRKLRFVWGDPGEVELTSLAQRNY